MCHPPDIETVESDWFLAPLFASTISPPPTAGITPLLNQTALAKATSWRFTETRLSGTELRVESLLPSCETSASGLKFVFELFNVAGR